MHDNPALHTASEMHEWVVPKLKTSLYDSSRDICLIYRKMRASCRTWNTLFYALCDIRCHFSFMMITTHLPGQFVEQGCGGDMFPGRLLLFVAGIIRLNVRKKDADASNQERCHCYSIVVILLCSARSR